MRLLAWGFYSFICIGIGWLVGSKFAAPPIIFDAADRIYLSSKARIAEVLEDKGASETPTAPALPTKTRDTTNHINQSLPAHALAGIVKLCKISISNAPPLNGSGEVDAYTQMIDIKGVTFAMMPVKDACISSGFGRRKGQLHKGVDYYSQSGGAVFAAADGQIVEAVYRSDYGFTVLLNHGNGYFTRYAHLKEFGPDVEVGAVVPLGYELGGMGQSSGFAIPIHLHFELLMGDYDTPKKSFGLTPVDIYNLD
ncbi:MAG: M23 family metallopeptidase [Parvularculaceae bacterium]